MRKMENQSLLSYHDTIPYLKDQRLYKTGTHAPPAMTAQNSPYLYSGSSIPYGSLCNLQNRPYGATATQFFKEATIPGVGAQEFNAPANDSLVTDVPPYQLPSSVEYQKILSQLQAAFPFGAPQNLKLLSCHDVPQLTNAGKQGASQLLLETLQPYQHQHLGEITKLLQVELELQRENAIKQEENHSIEKKELKANMEEMFTNLLDQAKRNWNLQAGYIVSFGISKAKEAGQLQRKITFLDKCVSHQKRRTRRAILDGQRKTKFLEKCVSHQKKRTHRVLLDGQKKLTKAQQSWNSERTQIIEQNGKTVQDQLELHQEAQDAWKREKEELLRKHKEELDVQTKAHQTSQEDLTGRCDKFQAQTSNLQKMLEEERRKTMDFEQLKSAHQNLLSKGEEKCQELLLFFSVRNSSKEDGDKKMLSSEPFSSGKSRQHHKRRAPRTSARMRQKRANAN